MEDEFYRQMSDVTTGPWALEPEDRPRQDQLNNLKMETIKLYFTSRSTPKMSRWVMLIEQAKNEPVYNY